VNGKVREHLELTPDPVAVKVEAGRRLGGLAATRPRRKVALWAWHGYDSTTTTHLLATRKRALDRGIQSEFTGTSNLKITHATGLTS
jgi:hypothetical protein